MKNYLILLFSLLLGLSGCASVQVSQDYDSRINFSALQSFDWHPKPIDYGNDVRESNPLLHKRFFEVINTALEEKGYGRAQKADFRVTYNYSIISKIESYPYSSYYGFGWGSHRRYGGIGYNYGSDVRQYDIGVLVIDIHDAVSDSLVWRGKGSELVTDHPTPQYTTEMVNRMVRKILTQFPPG